MKNKKQNNSKITNIEDIKDTVYNTIYKTKNYDQFKFVRWNRLVKPDHLESLQKSLENGLFSIPILVNKDMEVLDGQHRLMVCKKLDIPVLYTIEKEDVSSHKIIIALNTRTKVWELRDYFEAYKQAGREEYIKMVEFMETYKEFRQIRMYVYLFALTTNNVSYEDIRGGTFKPKDLELTKLITEKLLQIRHEDCFTLRNLDLCKNQRLFCACYDLVKNKDYDYKRFHEKSLKYPTKIFPCTSTSEYKEMLYNFYNYKQSVSTKIVI